MATKRKVRKFAEGGFETTEGQNKNIGDDVRARAMRSVMPDDSPAGTSTYGEQNEAPVTVTKTKTSVTAPKPKGESPEEYKARMEGLVKKQALERVEPEDYVPGTGLLKGMIKRGLKTISRQALPSPKKDLPELASPTPRLPAPTPRLPAPKAETLSAMEKKEVSGMKSRINKNDDAETVVRARAAMLRGKDNDAASKAVRARASKVLEEGMKKGGSVRSSASKRADGCAIRGKTRA